MENSDITVIKNESKNKNLGKFQKKAIYLNHGKYGYFLNHNKINYKIIGYIGSMNNKPNKKSTP